jgi:hypothetical protein
MLRLLRLVPERFQRLTRATGKSAQHETQHEKARRQSTGWITPRHFNIMDAGRLQLGGDLLGGPSPRS